MDKSTVEKFCQTCGCWKRKEGEEDVGICSNSASPDYNKKLGFINTCDSWEPISLTK